MTTFYAGISVPRPTVSTPARLDWILGLLELSRASDCKQSIGEPKHLFLDESLVTVTPT